MILNIISSSPFKDNKFISCLRIIDNQDGLLLTGDAVYAILKNTLYRKMLEKLNKTIRLYALLSDLEARNISDIPNNINIINYKQFVELTTTFNVINSWI